MAPVEPVIPITIRRGFAAARASSATSGNLPRARIGAAAGGSGGPSRRFATRRALAASAVIVACAAGPLRAQEPSGPPPPAGGGGDAGARYHELLPDIGLIGAQVGI